MAAVIWKQISTPAPRSNCLCALCLIEETTWLRRGSIRRSIFSKTCNFQRKKSRTCGNSPCLPVRAAISSNISHSSFFRRRVGDAGGHCGFSRRADFARHRPDCGGADCRDFLAGGDQFSDHDRQQGGARDSGGSRSERDRIRHFGAAHGMESGVLAARARSSAVARELSNVAAGHQFGIPIYGTQAHSWIMAHADEEEPSGDFSIFSPTTPCCWSIPMTFAQR